MSVENPIAHEYMLLSRAEGETLSDIYSTLDEEQIRGILDQLIDILAQLHTHDWDTIGGLNINAEGEIAVTKIVDETFWQVPDLSLWPETETVASLNIAGPYPSYVDYLSAQIRQHMRLIAIHDKLAFMRSDIPRLEAFLTKVPFSSTPPSSTLRSCGWCTRTSTSPMCCTTRRRVRSQRFSTGSFQRSCHSSCGTHDERFSRPDKRARQPGRRRCGSWSSSPRNARRDASASWKMRPLRLRCRRRCRKWRTLYVPLWRCRRGISGRTSCPAGELRR